MRETHREGRGTKLYRQQAKQNKNKKRETQIAMKKQRQKIRV